MTALKWITNEAKRLRRKHPRRFATWREYVAEASAIYARKHKGKSPVGHKRKKVSNVETKSKSHVDKNRMTTNIQIGGVASGNSEVLRHIAEENDRLLSTEKRIYNLKTYIVSAEPKRRATLRRELTREKAYLRTIKQNIQRLKKNIR